MFVEKLKEEVYDVIKNQRVLVLVSMDVDSLCACKILQWLFKCDNVQYTIVPVRGKEDLVRAYHEHYEQLKHIFLINCGGNLNILEILEPEEDVLFYISDSHRPLDLDNIYNQDQVKLLMKEGEHLSVPDFDDIYADSEDEFEDSDEEGSEPSSKRRRTGDGDSPLSKRQSKRRWHQNRQEILYQYYAYAFHGSAVVEEQDFITFTAFQVNVPFVSFITHAVCSKTALPFQNGLKKHCQSPQGSMHFKCYDSQKIWYSRLPERDEENIIVMASLVMYELAWKMSKDSNDLLWWAAVGLTHQYLYEKIDSDKYVTDAQNLHEHVMRHNHGRDDNGTSINCLKIGFDTELQLSLYRHWSLFESICHSRYTACRFRVWTNKGKNKIKEFLADMGIPLVQSQQKFSSMDFELRSILKPSVEKSSERFGLDEISYGSFNVQYGFKTKKEGTTKWDNFLEALDALSRTNTDKLQDGIEMGKKQLIAVVNQVNTLIGMNQVMCAGHFLYSHVREVSGRYACVRWTGLSLGTCLLIGIPPIADESGKNFLGKAFEMAASKTKSRTIHDHFDPAVIEIKSEDRGKFFDALSALLIPK
ncbi:PREDICTED: LOW QUALITY PROTEIN: cell division control protein 45 homolog [Acropora digitifera]|uniref:LOW QUALITY PROTEIN: cell division control protein 45 homolog n=1 Tax=Acropora digitifera TaxID=70779 RepID=UPI00077A6B4E|nr:PREDICTED: LOW QUALITY PROTEIN: cell division control protein 45 homolog [Acropora digitifera]